jgi:LEA14-like dessication related protein
MLGSISLRNSTLALASAALVAIAIPSAEAKEPLPGQQVTPDVEIINMMPTEQGPYDHTLVLVLALTNPTDRTMLIDGLTANVTLNGAALGSGVGMGSLTIPPEEERVVILSARTDRAMLETQQNLLVPASAEPDKRVPTPPWTISGQFYADGPYGAEVYPYHFSGALFAPEN